MAKKSTNKKTAKTTNKKPVPAMPLKWWNNWKLISILLFVLSFALYGNSLINGFVKNDTSLITKNNYTKKGLEGLAEIFSNNTFKGRYGEEADIVDVDYGLYRPLSTGFFAVFYEFFYGQPMPFHIWAIFLYGLCVAVIYLTLRLFFEKIIDKKNAAIFSFTSSVLFLFHPVHSEVVNNISNCDEILSLLFGISSLFFALKYIEDKKIIKVLISGLLAFLAYMSHDNAAVFLAITPITLWFATKNKKAKTILPIAISLFVFYGLFYLIKKSAVGNTLTGDPLNILTNPFVKIVNNEWVHFSFGEKMAAIFHALGKYIQLLVFPHPLTTDYNPRYIPISSMGNIKSISALVLYSAVFVFTIYNVIKGKKNLLVYGLLIFLISILFVSNLFFPIGYSLSEVFLFQPSLGFCIGISGLIYILTKDKENAFNKMILPFLCIFILASSFKTITRNSDFESNKILLNKDIQVSPNSAILHYTLGSLKAEDALNTLGTTEKAALSSEALALLNKAIEINPNYIEAYYMKGNVNYMQGLYEKAVENYEVCLALNPNYNRVLANLALGLKETSKTYINNKTNIPKAIEMLNRSYQIFNDKEVVDLLEQARFLLNTENINQNN